MAAFGSIELENLLGAGAITARSVRLWARTIGPGDYVLVLARATTEIDRVGVRIDDPAADFTAAWTYPDDFAGAPELAPDEPYRARLERGGEVIAEATFRTAPASSASPRRWTFGAFSCHQPFSPDGTVNEAGAAMLDAAYQALAELTARFVLMMGDQIYGDYPPSLSLFEPSYFSRVAPEGAETILECTIPEVRALYHQRHRQFWALPGFQRIQSSFACYPILDDHEVVDNFGTDPDHADPVWEAVRAGALDAFYDYQGSRVLRRTPDGQRPPVFDYGFTWGPTATYVMDIRSPRRTSRDGKTRVYTDAQLEALRSFLEANADRPLLSLVTTIPLVYVEGKLVKVASFLLSKGSDIHERWSHPQCIEHRDRLIRALHDHSLRHPRQQILLLGGDVHTGAAYEIQFDDGPRWFQLISSAISNSESLLLNKSAELASRSFSEIDIEDGPRADVNLLAGTDPHHRNPVGALNIGLVEVIERGGQVALELKLVTEAGGGRPQLIFASGELPPPRTDRASGRR